MIGLVNAAGTPGVAQTQVAERAARSVVGGIFLPIERSNDPAGFRVLRSAIERTRFDRSESERKAPCGEESDRLAEAEAQGRTPATPLGQLLDVTA